MHFDLYNNKQEILSYIESTHCYTIAMTNLPQLYEQYAAQIDWKKYYHCRLALGFHPELASQYSNQIGVFSRMLSSTRYVGEIGLDFTTHDKENENCQLKIFQKVIDDCNVQGGKILSIHSRNAVPETLHILSSFNGKAVFHWYSGSLTDLSDIIERGYYLSINHQMILSKKGQKIVDSIPLERILIESDAPFTLGLGSKYSMLFAEKVYTYLSETRNIQVDKLALEIKSNFKTLLS
jgi:TatD DNase family protein